jgi:hypothetical protein
VIQAAGRTWRTGGPAAAILTAALLALLVGIVSPVAAQEPPDSVERGDSLQALDSLVVPIPQVAPQEADTTGQAADSLPLRELPLLGGLPPSRPGTHSWAWSRDELLGEPAFTLLELLERLPGMLPLRFGDYGAPEGVLGPGLTGGRVRIFLDGFEAVALDGSIPDLSRISLGALSQLRVERAAGELRIHLTALRPDDARPLSLVEAGTGDFDTNMFRGTFLAPRALGGSLGLSLERLDSRGSVPDESGSRQGLWFRYALHRGEAAGLAFELRRATAEFEHDSLPIPPSITRTDWAVRGRLRVAEGVVAEAFTGVSSLSSEADSLTPLDGRRRQHGVRLGVERGPIFGRAEGRLLGGPELPSLRLDLSTGGRIERLGGVAVDWSADRWHGRTVSTRGVRAWSEPFYGVSAFAGWESGERGARVFLPREALPDPEEDDEEAGSTAQQEEEEEEEEPEEPPPTHHFSEITTLRVGGRLNLGPLDVSAAWIRTEADSVLPLGLLPDRGAVPLSGDEVTGFEVSGRVRVWQGFGLVGGLVQWQDEGIYRPRRVYRGGLDFHDVFYPSGNLEVWGGLQVEGRDPMLLPLTTGPVEAPVPARVPFYQSWNLHLQIRVQTVRIFYRLENAFLHRNNQDFPERILPTTRSMYGVRWTLWN